MLEKTIKCDHLAADKPMRLKLKASPEECKALAERFDWQNLSSLVAELEIQTIAKDAYHVSGQIEAAIIHKCRVTENPVSENITISVDERFALLDEAEVEIDPLALSVESIENSEIPLGEMIAQLVGLEAEAWPRAVEADDYLSRHESAAINPFASLAQLKKKV